MSDTKWDIYMLGEPQLGVEKATLVRNLATIFKKDIPVIEKMLHKPRNLIKADVDQATANKYKQAIDKAGGLCELVERHHQPATEQLFPNDALSPTAPRTTIPTPAFSMVPLESATASAANNSAASAATVESPYLAPQSHSENPSHFCFKCGASLYMGMTHCPKCLTEQPHFSSKSKITAGFLAFFLGGFGVHRFYLGQWWGVFYLLFWGSLIPSIISLIEAFVFWLTPAERWQRKYGQVPAKGPGMVVALVVGAILFVMILGILAAVALPAYQDYTVRAKIQAATPLVNETRATVENVILEKNFFPSENIMAGLPENISNQFVKSIQLGEGAQVVVTYNAANAPTIIWTPEKAGTKIVWDCKGGSMRDKQRPPECRGGDGLSTSPAPATTPTVKSNNPSASTRIYSDDKKVSLVVPGTWKGARELNTEAILGVADAAAENYALVMKEAKTDFEPNLDAAGYLVRVVQNLQAGSSGFRELQRAKTVAIQNRPARQQEVALTIQNVKIIYLLTAVETETDFYLLYTWSLENRYERNKAILGKVSSSFAIYK